MYSVGVLLYNYAYIWHGDVINIPAHYTYKQHCKSTTTNMTAMRNFEVIILSNRINNELMFRTKIHATDKQASSFLLNSSFIVVHCYLFVYLFSKYG